MRIICVFGIGMLFGVLRGKLFFQFQGVHTHTKKYVFPFQRTYIHDLIPKPLFDAPNLWFYIIFYCELLLSRLRIDSKSTFFRAFQYSNWISIPFISILFQ